MFFSDPGSGWLIALADSMLTAIVFFAVVIFVIAVLMEMIHFLSGHNGIHPTVWFYREAKKFWNNL